jgi:hypothetical protein
LSLKAQYNQTLGAFTQTGTATLLINGQFGQALGAFTQVAAGAAPGAAINGAASQTLASFTQTATGTQGSISSAYGWTTHFYKKRNKRKTKPSDIEEFFNMFETRLIDEAPAPIAAQAYEAQAASQAYLKTNEDAAEAKALKAKALAEINEFYALLRAADKRRRDEQDEDDIEEFLLLGF